MPCRARLLGLWGTDADGSWVPMAVAAMAERGRLPHAAPALGTEGLPRAFLQSLRTLFDILDDRQRGYVHLREIESRWQGADARELPCGVLEGLRQVAPANGYLTFERFVAGLRTSLLNANSAPRDQARVAPRSGDQPSLQQRLMFVPADEPRTVLERKPLPPSARPAPADPSGTSRNPELLCVPAEAAPCPKEPERLLSKTLERSPSADAGEFGRPPLPVPPLNPWDLCWKLETGRVSSRGMEMGITVGRPQSLKQGWDHLDGRGLRPVPV